MKNAFRRYSLIYTNANKISMDFFHCSFLAKKTTSNKFLNKITHNIQVFSYFHLL